MRAVSPLFGPPVVLHNTQVKRRFWRAPTAMDHLARNADGDELIFVHEGEGEFFCDYGHLSYIAGDYIVLPRSTMWRIQGTKPVCALLVEATGSSYMLPDKGMMGRHAIFDEAMLDTPQSDDAIRAQKSSDLQQEVYVKIKRGGRLATITYRFNPLNAVGWKGGGIAAKLLDRSPDVSRRFQ